MASRTDTAEDHALAEPPIIWLLGLPGSGQTSLIAGLLDQWRSALRHELAPATASAEALAWPPEAPRIRFLVTTGFTGEAAYDPAEELAWIGEAPTLILAVLRADEPDAGQLHDLLTRLRAQGLYAPILLVQTHLHALYPRSAGHIMPYPYGTDGRPGPGVPAALSEALKRQRARFDGMVAGIIPVDLTSAAQGFPPGDYGLAALQAAIRRVVPEWAMVLAPPASPEVGLWPRAILPWALAAAVLDAIPGLGGLAGTATQALLLRAISRRFGLGSDVAVWANATGVLGAGLVLRSGLAWLLAGLDPPWSVAALAAWTFLASCLIGAIAVRFCRNETLDYHPSGARPARVEQAVGRGGARF